MGEGVAAAVPGEVETGEVETAVVAVVAIDSPRATVEFL